MNAKVLDALNKQIGIELGNHNTYLYISSVFYKRGMLNTSAMLKSQASDEKSHAEGIVSYLDKQGLNYTMPAIPAVASSPDGDDTTAGWMESLVTLEHETTAALDAVGQAANKDNDLTTVDFVTNYLNEQIEEEDEARQHVMWANKAGSDLMFDLYVGKK